MTTLSISLPQIQLFLFIFLRVSAMTLTVPVFDSRSIPAVFKIGLCFTITLVLYPIVRLEPVAFSPSMIPFAIGIACEIVTGVIIGFLIRLIFTGIQLAGELVAFQMGFSVASVIDPMSSSQVPVISQMIYMFAILIFLTTNAHHWVLRALVESFNLIPPFGFHSSGGSDDPPHSGCWRSVRERCQGWFTRDRFSASGQPGPGPGRPDRSADECIYGSHAGKYFDWFFLSFSLASDDDDVFKSTAERAGKGNASDHETDGTLGQTHGG